jgi:chromosome segregation ATPase
VQVSGLEREKAQLGLRVEELQTLADDETRQKLAWQSRTKAAEAEVGQAKELLAEKDEEVSAFQRQVAQLKTAIDDGRTKAQRDALALEEADAARKKLAKDNEALEAQIDEVRPFISCPAFARRNRITNAVYLLRSSTRPAASSQARTRGCRARRKT